MIAPDAELLEVVAELGTDERRVLVALARRLLGGQRAYGRLDVATDRRDWRRERAFELADALVYGAIAEVAATVARPAVAPAMALDDDEPSAGDLVIVEVRRATG